MSDEKNTSQEQKRIYHAFMNAEPYSSQVPDHRLSRLADMPEASTAANALRHRILAEIYTSGNNFADPGIFYNSEHETCFEWAGPGSPRFVSIVCCSDGSADCYSLDVSSREEFFARLDERLTAWFLHAYVPRR